MKKMDEILVNCRFCKNAGAVVDVETTKQVQYTCAECGETSFFGGDLMEKLRETLEDVARSYGVLAKKSGNFLLVTDDVKMGVYFNELGEVTTLVHQDETKQIKG